VYRRFRVCISYNVLLALLKLVSKAYTTSDSVVTYLNHAQIAQTTPSFGLWRATAEENCENSDRSGVQVLIKCRDRDRSSFVVVRQLIDIAWLNEIINRTSQSINCSLYSTYLDLLCRKKLIQPIHNNSNIYS